MENRKILLTTMIIFVFLSIVIMPKVVSQKTGIIEPVGEPTYYIFLEKDPRIQYRINLTLVNNDDEASCPIEIRLYEDDKPTELCYNCDNVVFDPYEQKDFVFNWNSTYKYKELEIKYFPANPDDSTDYNTGSISVYIGGKTSKDDGIPGFEILLIILSLVIVIYIKRK